MPSAFLGLLAAMLLLLGLALLLLCWSAVGAVGLGLVGFAASLTAGVTACMPRECISMQCIQTALPSVRRDRPAIAEHVSGSHAISDYAAEAIHPCSKQHTKT